MGQYNVCLPSEPILCAFQTITQPLIERIIANIHENRTLDETRDSLLPKLISGNLRLKEAETYLKGMLC